MTVHAGGGPFRSVCIGAVADVHWSLDPNLQAAYHNPLRFDGADIRVRHALEHFRRSGVDVVALLGDFAQAGDSASLEAFFDLCRRTWNGPTMVVQGNHDALQSADHLSAALDRVGLQTTSTLEVEQVQIACLEPTSTSSGLTAVHPPRTLRGTATVVLTHYPILSASDRFEANGLKYAGNHPDANEVIAALSAAGQPTIILCGHLHARSTIHDGPILQFGLGSLIESPHEYAIVELGRLAAGGVLQARRSSRSLSVESGPHGPALSPADERWRYDSNGWLPQ